VTPFVGSVYWNVQCGIVEALTKNCGATPPAVVNFADTSGLAGVDAADAEPTANAAIAASTAPAASHLKVRRVIGPLSLLSLSME
jgi:hypothetical protein